MADHFGSNDPLLMTGVLEIFKADKVSLVAKRDRIICEVARKYAGRLNTNAKIKLSENGTSTRTYKDLIEVS